MRATLKHYYIYFHDHILGGPCYLKISSYLSFPCEFYLNGHNVIKVQLEEKGIAYKVIKLKLKATPLPGWKILSHYSK